MLEIYAKSSRKDNSKKNLKLNHESFITLAIKKLSLN